MDMNNTSFEFCCGLDRASAERPSILPHHSIVGAATDRALAAPASTENKGEGPPLNNSPGL